MQESPQVPPGSSNSAAVTTTHREAATQSVGTATEPQQQQAVEPIPYSPLALFSPAALARRRKSSSASSTAVDSATSSNSSNSSEHVPPTQGRDIRHAVAARLQEQLLRQGLKKLPSKRRPPLPTPSIGTTTTNTVADGSPAMNTTTPELLRRMFELALARRRARDSSVPALPVVVRLPSEVCHGTRCAHVEYWKRLRAKKGISFFVCRLCGMKWRAPSRSDECAVLSEQGLTPISSRDSVVLPSSSQHTSTSDFDAPAPLTSVSRSHSSDLTSYHNHHLHLPSEPELDPEFSFDLESLLLQSGIEDFAAPAVATTCEQLLLATSSTTSAFNLFSQAAEAFP